MNTPTLVARQEVTDQDFLKDLRRQTADAHQQLEAHAISRRIASPEITEERYEAYLEIMARVMQGADAVLRPALEAVLPDLHARKKQAWFIADLGSLAFEANPYPAFSLRLREENTAYALGAYYVLEGSTLGGRVILKSLPPTLADRTRYFEGYGPETAKMWQSFLASLCRLAQTQEAQYSVIRGATDTFAAIYRYFNTCTEHEATRHSQS